jgi:hypothetical protein
LASACLCSPNCSFQPCYLSHQSLSLRFYCTGFAPIPFRSFAVSIVDRRDLGLSSTSTAGHTYFTPSAMYFPKAAAVLLCAAALSEAFSIPEVGYHLAARSPQNFGQGGFGGGQNGANNNNNNPAKANSGGGNAKTSTTAAAAVSSATKAATGNNGNNNNAAAGNDAAAGTACLKSNAVQTGSADDGNATPTDGQSASAT